MFQYMYFKHSFLIFCLWSKCFIEWHSVQNWICSWVNTCICTIILLKIWILLLCLSLCAIVQHLHMHVKRCLVRWKVESYRPKLKFIDCYFFCFREILWLISHGYLYKYSYISYNVCLNLSNPCPSIYNTLTLLYYTNVLCLLQWPLSNINYTFNTISFLEDFGHFYVTYLSDVHQMEKKHLCRMKKSDR